MLKIDISDSRRLIDDTLINKILSDKDITLSDLLQKVVKCCYVNDDEYIVFGIMKDYDIMLYSTNNESKYFDTLLKRLRGIDYDLGKLQKLPLHSVLSDDIIVIDGEVYK